MNAGDDDYRVFFVNWCSHLLERLVRFDRYLTERTGDAPSQGSAKHNVVENLRDDVIRIAETLHAIAHRISQRGEIPLVDANSYISQLQPVVRQIIEAHHRLAYLPQPWAEQDTGILIDNVIRERLAAPVFEAQKSTALPHSPWAIVLTNEYNLSNIIVDKRELPQVSESPFPFVLSLPAIEKDNTLVWANLFHEVGHSVAADRKLCDGIFSNSSLLKKKTPNNVIIEGD
jgi:hypothetical protein